MITLIKVEFKKIKRSRIMYITFFTLLLFSLLNISNGSRCYSGIKYYEQTGWLCKSALSLGTFYIIPVLFSLIGSYIINREYQDNTLKNLMTVPIKIPTLIHAKLITSYIISLIISCVFFIFTIISEIIVGNSISLIFFIENLWKFILQGTGSFIAITPIIALVVILKKGYWISIILTSIYSFIGIFIASTRLNNIYPITAVFGFSGFYETTPFAYIVCCISLLLSIIIALFMLTFSHGYNDKI